MSAATVLGFDFSTTPVGALCRAIKADGKLASRHCTMTEVTNFLNLFFKTDESNRLTSHSLKDTTLSWAAKCGLPEVVRTVLGHGEHFITGKE